MEQLDLVYSTLTSLEKNYARSKKSRSEYLKEKFGGDIGIGSFLILNALQAAELKDPEDVKKLSTVRRIIDSIRENEGQLDSLSSFDFDTEAAHSKLINALAAGLSQGSGISIVSQSYLYKNGRGALSYRVSADKVQVVPVNQAEYFEIILPAWAAMFSGGNPSAYAEGQLLKRDAWGKLNPVEKVELDG